MSREFPSLDRAPATWRYRLSEVQRILGIDRKTILARALDPRLGIGIDNIGTIERPRWRMTPTQIRAIEDSFRTAPATAPRRDYPEPADKRPPRRAIKPRL